MRLLAVETSTSESSVALALDDGAVHDEPLPSGRLQTETLMAAIDRLLRRCGVAVRALEGFAVAVGPGAFIGVRVGIATVKGLALATGKAVVPISTLEALARRATEIEQSEAEPPRLICAMLDARRGEVYAACYRPSGQDGLERVGEERLIRPEVWVRELTGPALFVGDGARLHRAAILERLGQAASFPAADIVAPGAAAVARLALGRWAEGAIDPAEVTAVYLRPAVEARSPEITHT